MYGPLTVYTCVQYVHYICEFTLLAPNLSKNIETCHIRTCMPHVCLDNQKVVAIGFVMSLRDHKIQNLSCSVNNVYFMCTVNCVGGQSEPRVK